jgi:hypothetical protein
MNDHGEMHLSRPPDEATVFCYSPISRLGRYVAAPITTAVVLLAVFLWQGNWSFWSSLFAVAVVAGAWVVHYHLWRSPLEIRIEGRTVIAQYRGGRYRSWPLAELQRSLRDRIGHWIGGTRVCSRDGTFAFRVWKVISNFEELKARIPGD